MVHPRQRAQPPPPEVDNQRPDVNRLILIAHKRGAPVGRERESVIQKNMKVTARRGIPCQREHHILHRFDDRLGGPLLGGSIHRCVFIRPDNNGRRKQDGKREMKRDCGR